MRGFVVVVVVLVFVLFSFVGVGAKQRTFAFNENLLVTENESFALICCFTL